MPPRPPLPAPAIISLIDQFDERGWFVLPSVGYAYIAGPFEGPAGEKCAKQWREWYLSLSAGQQSEWNNAYHDCDPANRPSIVCIAGGSVKILVWANGTVRKLEVGQWPDMREVYA